MAEIRPVKLTRFRDGDNLTPARAFYTRPLGAAFDTVFGWFWATLQPPKKKCAMSTDPPDEAEITEFIAQTCAGMDIQRIDGDCFYIYDPERKFEGVQRIPFATLITRNDYDTVSDLDRPGIFRLNIGVGKETYLRLLGTPPARPGASGIIEGNYDFTALDTILPHPIYGFMNWICVLNPSRATFEMLKPMLSEAHALAAKRNGTKHAG